MRLGPDQKRTEQNKSLTLANPAPRQSVVERVTIIPAEASSADQPQAMVSREEVRGAVLSLVADVVTPSLPEPVRVFAQNPPVLTLPDNTLQLAAGSSERYLDGPVQRPMPLTLPGNTLELAAGFSAGYPAQSVHGAAAVDSAIEPWAPLLQEFPKSYRESVPSIRMNAHAYHQRGTLRYVAVDLKRYIEGDEIADGMRMESITRDGIIVQYRGTRFRLLRP